MADVKVRKCDWPDCQTPIDQGVVRYRIAADDRAPVTVDLCPEHEREPLTDVMRGRSKKQPATSRARIVEAKRKS